MMELGLSAAVFFTFIVFLLILFKLYAKSRIELIDWVVISYTSFYGVGSYLVYHYSRLGFNPVWDVYLHGFDRNYLYYMKDVVLALVGLLAGWYMVKGSIDFKSSAGKNITSASQNRLFSISAWFFIVLAIFLQFIYSFAYGGFLGVYDIASALRSGSTEIPYNPFSFLQPFTAIALVASYLFFGLYRSRYYKIYSLIGFLVSAAFSIYLLSTWLGRMGFVIYISSFFLYFFVSRFNRRPLILLASLSISMFLMLWGLDIITRLIGFRSFSSFGELLVAEFSFPTVGYQVYLNSDESYRYFKDYIYSPFYLFPTSIWSYFVENRAGDIITTLVLGSKKGEDGATGAMPVDLVTLGAMQVPLVGALFSGFIYGFFISCVDGMLSKIKDSNLRNMFLSVVILKFCIFNVFYSDTFQVVYGNFAFIFCLIAVFLIRFIKMDKVIAKL